MDINASYQRLFNNAKLFRKEYECMNCYDEMKPLYVETNVSRVGLGATLLQTRVGTCCPKGEYLTTDSIHE